jgi:hypothetical protein
MFASDNNTPVITALAVVGLSSLNDVVTTGHSHLLDRYEYELL